jgi:hypothetical protein
MSSVDKIVDLAYTINFPFFVSYMYPILSIAINKVESKPSEN